MSGKVRQRGAANTADSATLTVNEKILRECHNLYTDPENGMDDFLRDMIYRELSKYIGMLMKNDGRLQSG